MDLSHHQYGGGTSLVTDAGVQYRGGITSVQRYQSHHQYGQGCAVQDYQNCSGGCIFLGK